MSTNKSDGPTRYDIDENGGKYEHADGDYILYAEWKELYGIAFNSCRELDEKVQALEAENARLREALKEAVDCLEHNATGSPAGGYTESTWQKLRAALGPKGG